MFRAPFLFHNSFSPGPFNTVTGHLQLSLYCFIYPSPLFRPFLLLPLVFPSPQAIRARAFEMEEALRHSFEALPKNSQGPKTHPETLFVLICIPQPSHPFHFPGHGRVGPAVSNYALHRQSAFWGVPVRQSVGPSVHRPTTQSVGRSVRSPTVPVSRSDGQCANPSVSQSACHPPPAGLASQHMCARGGPEPPPPPPQARPSPPAPPASQAMHVAARMCLQMGHSSHRFVQACQFALQHVESCPNSMQHCVCKWGVPRLLT